MLRLRLVTVAVCLVAAGAAVIGSASVLVARASLMRQADQHLRAYAAVLVSRAFTATPASRLPPGPGGLGSGGFGIEVLSSAGQLMMRTGRIPAVTGQAVAGAGRLAAVPAGSGGGGWVVIAEPVRYREQRILFTYGYDDVSLFIASRDRPGLAGTLIVGLDLSDVDRIIGRFALACLALGGVATVAVAFLSGMGLRALLRPRRSGTSAQSEAAARSSSERLSRSIMDTGHKLQGPLSVVRGSAEYYRQRDGLSPAELDRMMWRVGAETTRLDALIDDLLSTGHDQPHPP